MKYEMVHNEAFSIWDIRKEEDEWVALCKEHDIELCADTYSDLLIEIGFYFRAYVKALYCPITKKEHDYDIDLICKDCKYDPDKEEDEEDEER